MTAVRAHPSLAIVKYWGKADDRRNLPATASLAVGLDAFSTETVCELADRDEVFIDDKPQSPARFSSFFDHLRELTGGRDHYRARSRNDFPTAAGLASSSSGFAALAAACLLARGDRPDPELVSRLALRGSASAARSAWGGP